MNTQALFESTAQMPFDDFLQLFREQTELGLATLPAFSLDEYRESGIVGTQWKPNTKWLNGMAQSEIEAAERKWNITFPPDYRRFLEVLGATNKKLLQARWIDNEKTIVKKPSFYNWNRDDSFIEEALNWPLKGLLFDVEHNNLWFESWGKRPQNQEDQFNVVRSLVKKAPRLISIIGHRYLLGEPVRANNPVLSVYQSDTIIYGMTLKKFLLVECAALLNINHDHAYENALSDYKREEILEIPFWGELIEGNAIEYDSDEN